MKDMSIRKKVTWYYSLVLVAVTVLVFGVFIITIDLQTNTISKSTLTDAVQNAFDEIESDHSVVEIDDDFDNYYKGVTLLVYSEKGTLIKGSVPSTFTKTVPLSAGHYRTVNISGEKWLVYDLYNTYENGQGIWIRGMYATDNSSATLRAVILSMLIILPLVLILSIIAGRRITGKAFEPVSEITAAADHINTGHDLSMRLPLSENRDELYYLTETLNSMIERLETAFVAEKQFSSDVSHELKTPMSVILSECELMLRENHEAAEYAESLEIIQKQCRRSMSMIRQLLQLSRTMDKDAVMEKELFDLSAVCSDTLDGFSQAAEMKGIHLERAIQNGIFFTGDQTMMIRAVSNLIANAIKYNDPPGEVMLALTQKDAHIIIAVKDDGIGISEKDMPNIFNRFYKADRSRTQTDDSFGLGLAMVKWMAEAHGGTVSAVSTRGSGSTFTITLNSAGE